MYVVTQLNSVLVAGAGVVPSWYCVKASSIQEQLCSSSRLTPVHQQQAQPLLSFILRLLHTNGLILFSHPGCVSSENIFLYKKLMLYVKKREGREHALGANRWNGPSRYTYGVNSSPLTPQAEPGSDNNCSMRRNKPHERYICMEKSSKHCSSIFSQIE